MSGCRTFLVAIMPLGVLIPAVAQGRVPFEAYRVTRQGGGLGVWIDETVKFSVSGLPANPHWIVERSRVDKNWCGSHDGEKGCKATVTSVHDWIDGTKCPALLQSLDELPMIPVSGIASPSDTNWSSMSDTPFTEVTALPSNAQGSGARIKLGAFTGPVVDWWDNAEKRLKVCWDSRAPLSE